MNGAAMVTDDIPYVDAALILAVVNGALLTALSVFSADPGTGRGDAASIARSTAKKKR